VNLERVREKKKAAKDEAALRQERQRLADGDSARVLNVEK
jgi:hypothetical protein